MNYSYVPTKINDRVIIMCKKLLIMLRSTFYHFVSPLTCLLVQYEFISKSSAKEEKLKQAKELFDKGLITGSVYE